MQTIAEILRGGPEARQPSPPETPSRDSTPNETAEAQDLFIRASEATARGYQAPAPAPSPVTCQYCGRQLEYCGLSIPTLAPDRIIMWKSEPERCTCAGAAAHWAAVDKAKAEAAEAEKHRKEQAAVAERIDRLIKKSGMKGRFQNRTFEQFQVTQENRKAFEQCLRYAQSLDMMLPTITGNTVTKPRKERNSLFLVGNYGTGKTHLAAAIANRLIQNGTPVICMTMIDLLAKVKETYDAAPGSSEEQIIRLYTEVPLLIIDDLGSEQPTEWGAAKIFQIINARYESYMPIIVTSNCGGEELAQRMTPKDGSDHNAKKTVDRLREMCVAIPMYGESWRTK